MKTLYWIRCRCYIVTIKVVLVFGSGKSRFWPMSEIRQSPAQAKSCGQIFSRIWWMRVQLQYIQLITHKTNAADLSTIAFAIIISVTWALKIRNSLLFHKFRQKTGKQWCNKGSTDLCCLFVAADSIVDAVSSVLFGVLFGDLSSKNMFSQIRLGSDLK